MNNTDLTGIPCIRCAACARGELECRWTAPCIGCGQELRHMHHHHAGEAFCSERRPEISYEQRERRRERKRRRLEGVPCACCGMRFQPRRGDAIYCGATCAKRMHRRRHAKRSDAIGEKILAVPGLTEQQALRLRRLWRL